MGYHSCILPYKAYFHHLLFCFQQKCAHTDVYACVNTLANTHIHAQNHSIHNVCIILLLSRKNSDRTPISVCLCGKSSICPAEVSCCESPPPAGCSIVPDLMMQGRGEVNSLFRMSGSVTLAL